MAFEQGKLAANLGNPLKQFKWRMEIPSVPGGGNAEILKIRCKSIVIPGFQVENIHLDYQDTPGLDVTGRTRVTGTLPVTFYEGEDTAVYNALKAWYNLIQDSGDDIAVRTDIYLYEIGANKVDVSKFQLFFAFIKEMSDSERNFDNGNVNLSAVFQYSDFKKF